MRWDVRRYASVGSTMDVARALAEQGAPQGTLIVADEQTSGRGRHGRTWFSPPGQALYASIVLRPALEPRQVGWITMLGALAVREAVGSQFSVLSSESGIKWFNDVMLAGRKLAGVLVEAAWVGDRLDFAVLGIGLNVNTSFDDAPDVVRARATSLRQALGHEVDREAVLNGLLAALHARYAALPASPVAEYARALDTLGKRVRLDLGTEVIAGDAVRVEDDGALVVATAHGERVVRHGDVIG